MDEAEGCEFSGPRLVKELKRTTYPRGGGGWGGGGDKPIPGPQRLVQPTEKGVRPALAALTLLPPAPLHRAFTTCTTLKCVFSVIPEWEVAACLGAFYVQSCLHWTFSESTLDQRETILFQVR